MKCYNCLGKGFTTDQRSQYEDTCPVCSGTGRIINATKEVKANLYDEELVECAFDLLNRIIEDARITIPQLYHSQFIYRGWPIRAAHLREGIKLLRKLQGANFEEEKRMYL